MPSQDHKVGRPLRAAKHSTVQLNVRITDAENDALRWHAAKRGESVAVLVREALESAGLFTMGRKRGG